MRDEVEHKGDSGAVGIGARRYRDAEGVSERLTKVRAAIDAPFLVTKPVNVLWLTGLDSSNAAVLVEPDRLRIFTDFRYLEKARTTGIEVVEIPLAELDDTISRCEDAKSLIGLMMLRELNS